jgi:4-diphosphocytidyl-2-C-methyl-D-erythritol kinase
MAKTYRVKSLAKINIGLRVLSKRKDNYHNIETIFYPVRLFDEISVKIEQINSGKNIINVKANLKKIREKDNTCYKTAALFLENFKFSGYRIDITVRKIIPTGAGLGGGSSDAASVLKVLSKHFKTTVGVQYTEPLRKIALGLGSDVPFFMLNKPAYAAGRGEKLTPLPRLKIYYKILIVNPGIHISTPWAYKELKIKKHKQRILNKVKKFDINDERLMENDFERVVFKKHPKIEKIKYDMFRLEAVYSLMSGSGSTVYGFFTPKKIKAAERYFRGLGYKTFMA